MPHASERRQPTKRATCFPLTWRRAPSRPEARPGLSARRRGDVAEADQGTGQVEEPLEQISHFYG
jgi:hypothetical protein